MPKKWDLKKIISLVSVHFSHTSLETPILNGIYPRFCLRTKVNTNNEEKLRISYMSQKYYEKLGKVLKVKGTYFYNVSSS